MIDLFFVGDGPRDGASLPPLVSRIVGQEVGGSFRAWKELRLNSERANVGRINSGDSGYDRKLLLAIAQARREHRQGLIAVVDRDKFPPGSRFADLERARKEHRERPATYLPVALGEAVPHVDAWLLDDPQAVRSALGLSDDHKIPSTKHTKNPKGCLNQLIGEILNTKDKDNDTLGEIARHVDFSRCRRPHETGYGDFIEEVKAELKPLARGATHDS